MNQATLYYQEALGSLPYVPDAAKRDMSRVVTLDRIAQCYQDKYALLLTRFIVYYLFKLTRVLLCVINYRGEQVAAEKYYKEAISVYDKSRAARPVAGLKDTASADPDEAPQIDREIPAVLYNYGQQLVHLQRWDEAQVYLARALKLTTGSSLPEEIVEKIQMMLHDIAGASSEDSDGGDEDSFETA